MSGVVLNLTASTAIAACTFLVHALVEKNHVIGLAGVILVYLLVAAQFGQFLLLLSLFLVYFISSAAITIASLTSIMMSF